MGRRMFSDRVTSSARFLKMPAAAQMLFFHLGMRADDEGVVEGFITMRMAGATEEDLKLLEEKGFVKILNEDLVTYIVDWEEHNQIRPDRAKASIYHGLLEKYLNTCGSAADCQAVDSNLPQTDGQSAADCQAVDSNLPQTDGQSAADCPHKISKDKISKDKISKDKTANAAGNHQSPFATKLVNNEAFAKLVALYQDNVHPIANQVEADDLASMFDEYGEEWMNQAIKEAARNNARSIKYITAVLQNWHKRGVLEPWKSKPGKKNKSWSEQKSDIADEALKYIEEVM